MDMSHRVMLGKVTVDWVRDSLIHFFFSSRRRHTRLQGDWSSDVCSSDLRVEKLEDADPHRLITSAAKSRYRVEPGFIRQLVFRDSLDNVQQLLCDEALEFAEEIGRAHV